MPAMLGGSSSSGSSGMVSPDRGLVALLELMVDSFVGDLTP